jgi:hypothetical protein
MATHNGMRGTPNPETRLSRRLWLLLAAALWDFAVDYDGVT